MEFFDGKASALKCLIFIFPVVQIKRSKTERFPSETKTPRVVKSQRRTTPLAFVFFDIKCLASPISSTVCSVVPHETTNRAVFERAL